MKKYYFLLGTGTVLVALVIFIFIIYQIVINKTKNNQSNPNFIGTIDDGFGLPDPSPISEKECSPNAQLVIKKFRPDILYSCTEEEVRFKNQTIPYIQINYVMTQTHSHQEFYAVIIDGKIELVSLKPQFYASYFYDYNSTDEINNTYNCEIEIDEWDKDNKISFEMVSYKNEYRWRINYNQVVGKNSKNKACIINGYEIKPPRYTEKSIFNLNVKNQ